jgi:hypothetical protein
MKLFSFLELHSLFFYGDYALLAQFTHVVAEDNGIKLIVMFELTQSNLEKMTCKHRSEKSINSDLGMNLFCLYLIYILKSQGL